MHGENVCTVVERWQSADVIALDPALRFIVCVEILQKASNGRALGCETSISGKQGPCVCVCAYVRARREIEGE